MGRLLILPLLLLLSAFCFSAGRKDRRFHVGHAEGKLNRAEPNQGGSGLCPCPESPTPQKQIKHGHMCHCDGFVVPQSGRHRRHPRHKSKHPPGHGKHKCRQSQTKCQHRYLMKGLQIPL